MKGVSTRGDVGARVRGEGVLAHERLRVGVHRVRVLKHEALRRVKHLASVVCDREGAALLELAHATHGVLLADLLRKLLVTATIAEAALVVERLQQARHQAESGGRRLQRALVDSNAFGGKQSVLRREHHLVELLLKHLVDVVDAELRGRAVGR